MNPHSSEKEDWHLRDLFDPEDITWQIGAIPYLFFFYKPIVTILSTNKQHFQGVLLLLFFLLLLINLECAKGQRVRMEKQIVKPWFTSNIMFINCPIQSAGLFLIQFVVLSTTSPPPPPPPLSPLWEHLWLGGLVYEICHSVGLDFLEEKKMHLFV